jgi:hypothetical protein
METREIRRDKALSVYTPAIQSGLRLQQRAACIMPLELLLLLLIMALGMVVKSREMWLTEDLIAGEPGTEGAPGLFV